jgi:hypothetical protein
VPEITVKRATLKEIGLLAGIDNASLIHDEQMVSLANGREPMCDNHNGAPTAKRPERLPNVKFRLHIEGRRRLVEQDDGCAFKKRTRNGQPQSFAAGQIAAILAQDGIEPRWQLFDKVAMGGARSRASRLMLRK